MNNSGRQIIEEISLADGKYTFRYNIDTCEFICLRNGEPWRDFLGDKAIWLLFSKAYETKYLLEDIERLKNEIEGQRERAAEWEDLYKSLARTTGNGRN